MEIPVFVQFGTPYGNTKFARDDGYHASAHTAFSWHSHAESKLSGLVIEAAGQHKCAEAFRAAHGENTLVVVWVDPVVG